MNATYLVNSPRAGLETADTLCVEGRALQRRHSMLRGVVVVVVDDAVSRRPDRKLNSGRTDQFHSLPHFYPLYKLDFNAFSLHMSFFYFSGVSFA